MNRKIYSGTVITISEGVPYEETCGPDRTVTIDSVGVTTTIPGYTEVTPWHRIDRVEIAQQVEV